MNEKKMRTILSILFYLYIKERCEILLLFKYVYYEFGEMPDFSWSIVTFLVSHYILTKTLKRNNTQIKELKSTHVIE
jgi:hypothetical protein